MDVWKQARSSSSRLFTLQRALKAVLHLPRKWESGWNDNTCHLSGCHRERYLPGQANNKITLFRSQNCYYYLPPHLPEISHMLGKIQILSSSLITTSGMIYQGSQMNFFCVPSYFSVQSVSGKKTPNPQIAKSLLTQWMKCNLGFMHYLHTFV